MGRRLKSGLPRGTTPGQPTKPQRQAGSGPLVVLPEGFDEAGMASPLQIVLVSDAHHFSSTKNS